MTAKMTRYSNADFGDDDSVNSVQLTEGISTSATHIRYHPGAKLWQVRSTMERILLFLTAFLFMVVIVLSIVVNVVEHHLQVAKKSIPKPRFIPKTGPARKAKYLLEMMLTLD